MIISRWRGFEIDSSEGFYVFDKDMEHVEEGWEFMLRLLTSPLLWDRVAFFVSSIEGEGDKVDDRLQGLLERGLPQESQPVSEYCQLPYVARIPAFLDLVKDLRSSLAVVEINFCLAPFAEMPVEELAKLKTWFFKQFSDRKKANERWKDYSKVRQSDFLLRGHSEMTDEWMETYAFEARFDLHLTTPFRYGMSISAGDPSLMLYLLASLTPRYDLEYLGDHYISINLQPDRLDLALSPAAEDEEPPD